MANVGLVILVIMAAILLLLAFVESAGNLILFLIIIALGFLGATKQCVIEWGAVSTNPEKAIKLNLNSLLQVIVLICGALLTYLINVYFGMGPVVAASLTGIIGAIVIKEHEAPVYCGAFIGMVPHELAQGFLFIALASLIAGLTFIISRCAFEGFGGKLGAIAFTGCVAAAAILNRPLLSSNGYEAPLFWPILLSASLGAVLTYTLSIRLRLGPVLASALVGLVGGLLLPTLIPATGSVLAVVLICASFAGMASQKRIPNEFLVLITALFVGLIYIFSSPYLDGFGGKLGTIAFAANLAVGGILLTVVRRRQADHGPER